MLSITAWATGAAWCASLALVLASILGDWHVGVLALGVAIPATMRLYLRAQREGARLTAAEAEARRSAAVLQQVLSVMPVGVIIANRHGEIVASNPTASAIWSGTRYVGKDRYEEYKAWWPDTGRRVAADEWALARAMRSGQVVHDEVVDIEAFDGSRKTILHSATPIVEEGSITGGVVTLQDITARRQVEAAMQRLNEELESRVAARTADLEAANRELEAFSYSVSHDLRAPLRTISGFCRILERDHGAELSTPARRYLGLVLSGASDMAHLIDDLLAFSRLNRQAIEPTCCDPGDLVRQALGMLAGDIGDREIDWRLGPLPRVHADRRLLLQVFLNLLSNAVKFTRTRERSVIEVGCTENNGAVFFVRDNGVGFDMKYANKMFGVFQRLHRAEEYEGTGVGLAIVHRAISRQGGRVWAEGSPGTGATISFTFAQGAEVRNAA